MKFMLMMNTPSGGEYQIMTWPKQDIEAHIAFMMGFAKKLQAAGELVGAEGLAPPSQAKRVRAGDDAKPITDGVFPEAKEFLAGYWIVDVSTPQRAYEIAAEASAAPGVGGKPMNMPIEVREVMSAPPEPEVTSRPSEPAFEHLLRELAPQVLGAVMRRYRDFAASEDAVQEALIAAAEQWPRDGVPNNPRGWLIQVALRRMTDHVRSEIARRTRESELAQELPVIVAPVIYSEPQMDPEDTLVLLFMCCHPALTSASAIALTLRAVGGLTTAEIAKAFLVPEATMAQRISRAKQSVKASQLPFSMPEANERTERTREVMHVLYLIFNEGYTASSGDSLQRTDLAIESLRLTRLLHALLPENPEITGLLALMLLTDARRAARTKPNGELIPLDEQDRSLWNQQIIAEGTSLVTAAMGRGAVGEYQLQAAIAALHDEATDVESTDWPQILALYSILKGMSGNPMVTLNHAVATAMVHGPRAGLALLEPLQKDERMSGTHRLDAVRAHLLERANDLDAANVAYLTAAEKTTSLPERNYLMTRAARLRERRR